MKASVIIPAYNAAQTIEYCLDALREQDVQAPMKLLSLMTVPAMRPRPWLPPPMFM